MLNTKMMKMMQLCGTVAVIFTANLFAVEAMEAGTEKPGESGTAVEQETTNHPEAIVPMTNPMAAGPPEEKAESEIEYTCVNSENDQFNWVCEAQRETNMHGYWQKTSTRPQREKDENGQCVGCANAVFCINYGTEQLWYGKERKCYLSHSSPQFRSEINKRRRSNDIFGWKRINDKWMCTSCSKPTTFLVERWARFRNTADSRNPKTSYVGLEILKSENDESRLKEVTAKFGAQHPNLKVNTKVTFLRTEEKKDGRYVVIKTVEDEEHTVKIEEWKNAEFFKPLMLGKVTLRNKHKGEPNIVVPMAELKVMGTRYIARACEGCTEWDNTTGNTGNLTGPRGRARKRRGEGRVPKHEYFNWSLIGRGEYTQCKQCEGTGYSYTKSSWSVVTFYE